MSLEESFQPDRNSFTPLYHQLRLWIEGQIRCGKYPPGTLLPSESQICQQFKVSSITARRALRELVLSGLVHRQPGVGTFVSASARHFKLALVLVGFEEIWWRRRAVSFSGLIGGIGRVAWAEGAAFSMVHLTSNEDLDSFLQAVIAEHSFDGLLIRAKSALSARHIQVLEQRSLPYVIVRTHLVERVGNCVIPPDEEDVYRATRHLVRLGHRRIAYAGGPREWPVNADKLRGYQCALSEAGIPDEVSLIREGESLESGDPKQAREIVAKLLRSDPSLTAIVIGSSPLVPVVYNAIEAEGLQIPGDISVAGSDEELIGWELVPILARFGPNHYDLGTRATEFLVEMIGKGMTPPREILLSPSFRPGPSAASPRAAATEHWEAPSVAASPAEMSETWKQRDVFTAQTIGKEPRGDAPPK